MSNQWEKVFNRPCSLQKDELALGAWLCRNPYHSLRSLAVFPSGATKGDYYTHTVDWRRLIQTMVKREEQLGLSASRHVRFFLNHKKTLLSSSQQLHSSHLNRLSSRALWKRYNQCVYQMWAWGLLTYFPFAVNDLLEPQLHQQLKKIFPKDCETLYLAITALTTETAVEKQHNALLHYAATGQLNRRLPAHAKKYGYLSVYGFHDRQWTPADFRRQVSTINHPADELRDIRRTLRQRRAMLAWAYSRLRGHKKLLALAKLVNVWVWLRTERVNVWRRSMSEAQPFYRELERRLKLPYGASSHLTTKEIQAYLCNGQLPARRLIHERQQNRYAVLFSHKKTEVMSDPLQIAKLSRSIIGHIDYSRIHQITGTPACPGQARGRVCLILSHDDVKKAKPGQIIVASMTHPDYMMALRHCRAIITDEGGITCHAAIIARELKKPAVIGTKIATDVFKSGDYIEVDATKGIVRKI